MLLSLSGYVKPALPTERSTGHWDAYIRMVGVRSLYEGFADKSLIHSPLKQQPYGDWEFEGRDPNGYVLVFGGTE